MKRIHDSLHHVFLRNRIVFWYDSTGEWAQTFESFENTHVTKLTVSGNEFGTKVRIIRDCNPATKYLLYIPTARPIDAENWLLDLLLQGHEYKADRASLALQEVGLPYEFRYLAEEHAVFFKSTARTQSLKNLITKDDTAAGIRLKMMAVLTEEEMDVDTLLLHFLHPQNEGVLLDPVLECFDSSALTDYFWKEVSQAFGYASNTPSLLDFAVALFRSANPLDEQRTVLLPHAKVFIQRWQDSHKFSSSFRRWALQMEKELQVAEALSSLIERRNLGDCDTFEIFDKYTLHGLCLSFSKNAASSDLQSVIQLRRSSFWQSQHDHGYAALGHAIELRELLASAELNIDSPTSGVNRYASTWWRIDAAYRHCIWHLRCYGQARVMEQVAQWVEKSYVNNFLLPLTDRWGDQLRKMSRWEAENVPLQRQFFDLYVAPYVSKGQKVFVIVSDALRYEAAAEFAVRLRFENRWTTEIDALLGSLPSYTQLGMAALLPGKELSVDALTGSVTVDGHSSTGTIERAKILSQACASRATAIQSTNFLELNTKTAGRDLMRDHEVIYIFHDTIDTIGHSLGTETKAFDAVEQAFDELEQIVKKVANINGTNMLLTADHGFLFQQDDVADDDSDAFPQADELSYRDRRFALGKGIVANPKVKIFSSEALNVQGDWSAAFPLSLVRFPLKGAGKRFVHGGASLQEVVIPVVKIHKARSDDTSRVEVIISRIPAKITTGQFSIAVLQESPAFDKMLPRTLRMGVFAKDGTLLSEMKTMTFDSKEEDARRRETIILLTLSNAADAFNNRDVDVRLEETLQGTNQTVIYRAHTIKIQKPFTSDFDEH
jgi:uncharacterized protein (TIGR02687 family)